MIIAHAHFTKEHFVETRATSHLAEWANFHTRCTHIHNETSESFVLGHVEVSTGDDLTDIAVVRATRPNLLTSDDPLFAVALGLGAETRKIATCSRLTE